MLLDPRRVKALFNAALDLADPVDRTAFLDKECGDDRELRQRLGELLAAYEQPAGTLEQPVAEYHGQATVFDGASIPSDDPDLIVAETAASLGSDRQSPGRKLHRRPRSSVA